MTLRDTQSRYRRGNLDDAHDGRRSDINWDDGFLATISLPTTLKMKSGINSIALLRAW